jgi:hypothetical protein
MRGPSGASTCAVLKVTNLKEVGDGFDAFFALATKTVTETSRGLGVMLFKGALNYSPQFSGDFTANWKFAVNWIDTSFKADIFPAAVDTSEKILWGDSRRGGYVKRKRLPVGGFLKGSTPAMNYAIAANKGRDKGFKLGDTINISNSAVHDEPYAMLIEENQIKFRPGNSGIPGRSAAADLVRIYNEKITYRMAKDLSKVKL